MRTKTRKTRSLCQRKQSLSHNGNCLWSVPVEKTGSLPLPTTKSITKQWPLVNDSSARTLDFCSSSANSVEQEEGIIIHLGGRLTPSRSKLGPHIALFSGKEMETKSQQGRGFVSGTLDWLVSCYNQNMLSRTMFETQKNRLFCPNSSLVKNASSFFV